MSTAFKELCSMTLDDSQIRAWSDCFDVLQDELPEVNRSHSGLQIIFEYALPFESGRRPDVILLSNEYIIILEFKQYGVVITHDVDQVRAYARDLREYHFESRGKKITPVLIMTGTKNVKPQHHKGIILCSRSWIRVLFNEIITSSVTTCDTIKWMNSKYEPLPTIVDAARTFMNHEALPNIRRVSSTVIPQAIRRLSAIANNAKLNKKHVLAIVTGVPGAGKTYLGLQYVYNIVESNTNANSIYLSGNGPLIRVLQDALKSKVFVRNVHTIVNEFNSGKINSFQKNIIVFDEGQRAWDVNQMQVKRNVCKSEPDIIVELCDSKLDWCVLLILVGEGQEIYNGENSGLVQWNTAIGAAHKDWTIVCPEKLKENFSIPVITEESLNLNQSIRTHTACEVSNFVNYFISGDISSASKKAEGIIMEGFDMYYTRNLESAKEYCKNRYYLCNNKRYGLISSSRNKNLWKYGLKPTFQADVAAWFNRDPANPLSSCALKITISEFDCQGLEIDMPIIGWGDDIRWGESSWMPSGSTQDEKDYRINSYRVLLTRGRDGFIVFIPPTPDMNVIESIFQKAGVKNLENN